jgi:hypothetical protein
MPKRPMPRRRTVALTLVGVIVAGGLLATAAVATNTFGAAHLYDRAWAKIDRFFAGPVPDRPTVATVRVTSAPATPEPTPTPAPTPAGTDDVGPPGSAVPTASPTPRPTPTPRRVPVDVDIVNHPAAIFAHEQKVTWCAPAGVQIVLAYLGKGDTSDGFQAKIDSRIGEWESWSDSHNGDWGPGAMALALEAYGAPGYEVRAYDTRLGALRDAAVAIEKTNSPVILLAWNGAHTWVMSGFRADGDPAIFPNAKISGAYILDPWFPDFSSIWGQSDPPGTFQDESEMIRNYRRWDRPEGNYKDRDGLFIAVVPTVVIPRN